jgi:hypothetical protein
MDQEPLSLFTRLRDRDYAREGLLVCEGRLVLEKAMAAGLCIRSILCVPADEEDWRIPGSCRDQGTVHEPAGNGGPGRLCLSPGGAGPGRASGLGCMSGSGCRCCQGWTASGETPGGMPGTTRSREIPGAMPWCSGMSPILTILVPWCAARRPWEHARCGWVRAVPTRSGEKR